MKETLQQNTAALAGKIDDLTEAMTFYLAQNSSDADAMAKPVTSSISGKTISFEGDGADHLARLEKIRSRIAALPEQTALTLMTLAQKHGINNDNAPDVKPG